MILNRKENDMSNEQVLVNFSTTDARHGLLVLNLRGVLKYLQSVAPIKSGDISSKFAELALNDATGTTFDNVVVLGSESDEVFLDFSGMVSGDLNFAIYEISFMDVLRKQAIVRRVQ